MKALLKFSVHYVLVCAMAIMTVVCLPAEDPDNHVENAVVERDVSVFPVDKEQMTKEDVAQFLREMKKLNQHMSTTSQTQNTTSSQSHEASVEAVSVLFGTTIPLAIGVAAGLLVLLVIAVAIFVCCCNKKNEKTDLTLNKELNRWDPQLLRPSKEHIDAFYFGPPIPSVAEMIKQ